MSTSKGSAILDTNILIYAADKTADYFEASKKIRDKSQNDEFLLCISPQILTEFYCVITNPKKVKNPLTKNQAIAEVEKYNKSEQFLKIYPNQKTLELMLKLLKLYPAKGVEIFDLFLVSTMLSNDVLQIYTFNIGHFKKFKEIKVLTPE